MFNASALGNSDATSSTLSCRLPNGKAANASGIGLLRCLCGFFGPKCDAQIVETVGELVLLAELANRHAPWHHPRATYLDSVSAAGWLRDRKLSRSAYAFLYKSLGFIALDELERVSMLHMVFLIASQGGIAQTIVVGEAFRVKQGTQVAAQELATKIGAPRIHLTTPVDHLTYSNDSVRVSAGGRAFSARRAILTGSPVGLGKLAFEPPLPTDKARLLQGMYMANTARYNLVFADGPVWTRENLTGIIVDGDMEDPVPYVFDATPPSGRPGVLQFWLFGDKVHTVEAMTDAQRASYLSKYLEQFIGPTAARYTSSVYHDFTRDAYIGGGFSAGDLPPLA